jgi:hypothetical protein
VTGDDCEGELMNERDVLAERFSAERTRLRAVAYRMLGSLAEAEDAVQEAWLRLARSDEAAIDNLSGWLTTVVGRVCLDMLRARTARREDADGRLPDPVVTYGDAWRSGPIPVRIVRAAQFHEFVAQLLEWGTQPRDAGQGHRDPQPGRTRRRLAGRGRLAARPGGTSGWPHVRDVARPAVTMEAGYPPILSAD